MSDQEHIQHLLQRLAGQQLTAAEKTALLELLQNRQQDAAIQEAIAQLMENQAAGATEDVSRWDERITAIVEMDKTPLPALLETSPAVRRMGRHWRVAASLLLVVGLGACLWYTLGRQQPAVLVKKALPLQEDVLPGGNKAILTLANGQQVVLDSAADGLLARQGTALVTKTGSGQLTYRSNATVGGAVLYNTMHTPRGGQYQLVLPDGTKVWLNAASSITYPTAFSGTTRVVTVTGEVYCEVAQDKSKPFLVKANNIQVEVLGTHFNIHAYADEAATRTTLLQGRIRVTQKMAGKERQAVVLQPGQQAQAAQRLTVVDKVNVGQVMAWKNGLFDFEGLDIQSVMQQLTRWYNIQVRYEGGIPRQTFHGAITRDLKLSQLIQLLEEVEVRCRIEGNTLIVQP